VGRTAQEVVTEVREQFVNKPGILTGTVCGIVWKRKRMRAWAQ